MKKRIQVAPISSDDLSAMSADISTGTNSTRNSRIRLRNSSSKANARKGSKRQHPSGLFSKRPYLYKAQNQPIPRSRRSSIIDEKSKYETNYEIPVHWIDWIDSGMEFFGCGIPTGMDVRSSENENLISSSPFRNGLGGSCSMNSYQQEQDMIAMKMRHLELLERDYAQLHEDFFDSMVKEEGDQMLASILASLTTANMPSIEETADLVNVSTGSSFSVGSAASSRLTMESNRSNRSLEAQISADSGSGHTRESIPSGHTRESNPSGHSRESTTNSVSSTSAVLLTRQRGISMEKCQNADSFEVYDERSDSNKAAPPLVPSLDKADENKKQKQPSSSTLNIREIMARSDLEDPTLYMHTQCKLQKDRGKGERLGAAISARGRGPTLEKLRDKMKVIVEMSGDLQITPSKQDEVNLKSMSAGMKRRRAKVSFIEHNGKCEYGLEDGSYTIETRSMIELQLGFLSMQYGLLLRWDAYRTGQIVFVCLRKMCHDSFYTKIRFPPPISSTGSISKSMGSRSTSEASSSFYPKSLLNQSLNSSHTDQAPKGRPPTIIAASKKRVSAPPLVVRSPNGGNHAIYQRASGATEVVLVDAPYRVPPPEVFAPSVLSLDVHRLTGLDPRSRWTLIMTFDGDTEIAHLKYNHSERVFETTRTDPCKWEISMMPQRQTVTSFDVATGLEIRLFEQRPKHRLRAVTKTGGKYSSNSSYVPPGSDPFSLHSPTKSYVVQNQRLIHFSNSSGSQRSRTLPRTNSESSLASTASGASGSNSTGRHSLKKSTSRLASTMTVPLGGLVCQPSTTQTTMWKLTIPFTHDEDAEVTLTLMHQSDYAHWLYQELRARRKEEIAATEKSWRLLGSKRGSRMNDYEDETNTEYSDESDDDVYFMEWLYYCCFPPTPVD